MTLTVIEPTRHDATAGAIAIAPFALGMAPFAVLIGSTAATVDQPLAGWAGSWLVFAGSAHLAALEGVAAGHALVAVVTALLVNARLLVYSTSVAPQWRDQPRWFRAIGAAMLVDATWALFEERSARGMSSVAQRRFFLGAGLTLGAVWSALIAIGALVGDRLPAAGLGLAAPLCLIALIRRRLQKRAHRWAAITAAAVAVVTVAWPAGSGIAAAIVAGCVAAAFAKRTER